MSYGEPLIQLFQTDFVLNLPLRTDMSYSEEGKFIEYYCKETREWLLIPNNTLTAKYMQGEKLSFSELSKFLEIVLNSRPCLGLPLIDAEIEYNLSFEMKSLAASLIQKTWKQHLARKPVSNLLTKIMSVVWENILSNTWDI